MKILVVGYMHPKYDKRVFRTVKALSKNNEVIYQYWTNQHEKGYIEGNIKYIPIYYVKNTHDNPMKKLRRRRSLDKDIKDIVKNEKYDVLYMHHFLASRPVAPFKEAKKRGKQVFFDIHEYHPENFLNSLEGFTKKIKEAIVWNFFKKQINYSDKLVFVSEDMKKDIFKSLGIEKDYFVLKNYAKNSVDSKSKKKSIAFVGGVNRNLDDEKEILKELINRGFEFNIIGMETDYFKEIDHNATSFLPYEEMMERLSEEAFSLISFNTVNSRSYKNDVFSLPNKYYDSIAAETPVIVRNSFVSMAKEVEEKNIGVVIDPNDVKDSVQKIENAYENYEEMMENIKKYKHEFVWTEEIEKDFVDFVVD